MPAQHISMTESFLHYIWKFKLFDHTHLKTISGEDVQIIKSGEHNTNAGPDFFNGRIKIGDTLWAGNIEIHVKSQDWNKHKHQSDAAYNNTIIHVSYEHDANVRNYNGQEIPSIELKKLIDPKVIEQYELMQKPSRFIPCEKLIQFQKNKDIESPVFENAWKTRLLVERLERKSNMILQFLKHSNDNWEETLYISIARNFGFHINADAFEMLAKSLPLSIILKHKNDITQIEALLFGQAGFLSSIALSGKETANENEYLTLLFREYKNLKTKFNLHPINHSAWKFLRLRPSNFPTIRIAQFAQLLYKREHLFSEIIEAPNVNRLLELLNVSALGYWDRHYTFGKVSGIKRKTLGEGSAENIIINTIVPFLFIYGQQKDKEEYKERAFAILEQLQPEKNSIVNNWKKLGIKINDAYSSQALLQLKKEYCSQQKCLSCNIGSLLLKS